MAGEEAGRLGDEIQCLDRMGAQGRHLLFRRATLSIGALLLITGSLLAYYAHSQIKSSWGRLERRVTELRFQASTRAGERSVLFGTPIPGNAWEEYEPAITRANQFPGGAADVSVCYQLLKGLLSPDERIKAEQRYYPLLNTLSGQFDQLLTGARKRDGNYPRNWEHLDSLDFGAPDLRAKNLAYPAILEAHRLADSGHNLAAVRLLLATLQLGRDVGSNGTILNEVLRNEICQAVGEELSVQVRSGKLGREELLELDRGLGLLDPGAIDSSASILNHILMFGEMILHGNVREASSLTGRAGPRPDSIQAGWRHLYSTKLLRSSAFRMMDQAALPLGQANGVGLAEAHRVLEDLRASARSSHNEFALALTNDFDALFGAQRAWLALLRLVRTASRYRATGEILTLQDPFGTALLHRVTRTTLKIWSVSGDGKDDGGIDGRDIVLETDR